MKKFILGIMVLQWCCETNSNSNNYIDMVITHIV